MIEIRKLCNLWSQLGLWDRIFVKNGARNDDLRR
jgi:hypothetical protein